MHDDAEGNPIPLASPELVEQPDRDLDRDVLGGVAGNARPAAVQDDAPVALDEQLVLAGLEETPVLGVARIVHRGDSLPGHGSILRTAAYAAV